MGEHIVFIMFLLCLCVENKSFIRGTVAVGTPADLVYVKLTYY